MKIKKLLLWVVMALGLMVVLSSAVVYYHGSDMVTKEMNGQAFDKVVIGSFFKVKFTQADSYKVRIEIAEDYEPYLKAEIKGGKLSLTMDHHRLPFNRMKFNDAAEVEISAPSFQLLDLMGASKLTLQGEWELEKASIRVQGATEMICEELEADQLRIEQQGASVFKGTLDVEELEIENSGSCKMELNNRNQDAGESLKLKVSGASKIDLGQLRFESVSLRASGASKIMVHPLERLEVSATGACKIEYKSTANLQKSIRTSGMAMVSVF